MLVAAMTVQAQGFGVQAGFNQSIMRENSLSEKNKLTAGDALNGFNAGIFYEHSFWKGLGLMYGLNYSFGTNRSKWSDKDKYGWQVRTSSMAHQLEIPISLQYKFMIAKQTYIVLYTGPVFSYGLSHQVKTNRRNAIQGETATLQNWYKIDVDGDATYDYGRFNLTWGLGMGLQFQNYTLRGGYNWGIMNHNVDGYYTGTSNNYYMKARADEWSIGLGYFFNAAKSKKH